MTSRLGTLVWIRYYLLLYSCAKVLYFFRDARSNLFLTYLYYIVLLPGWCGVLWAFPAAKWPITYLLVPSWQSCGTPFPWNGPLGADVICVLAEYFKLRSVYGWIHLLERTTRAMENLQQRAVITVFDINDVLWHMLAIKERYRTNQLLFWWDMLRYWYEN